MSRAKINLLQCMEETGWPKDHILALATFYLNLKNHPKCQEPDGDVVLLAYQAQVCREWHIELKSTTGKPAFDISIINDDLVEKIGIKMWNRTKMLLVTRLVFPLLLGRFAMLIICFHPFSATHCMCYPPPPPLFVPPSHMQPMLCASCYPYHYLHIHPSLNLRLEQELSRATLNSSPIKTSSPAHHNQKFSPYPKAEKRGRSSSPTHNDTPTHRQATFSACTLCLGRHRHNVAICSSPTLWDQKTPAYCFHNENNRLVNAKGFILCSNWQQPNGCNSTTHNSRHECSGHGKLDHGAQKCPRAEKA